MLENEENKMVPDAAESTPTASEEKSEAAAATEAPQQPAAGESVKKPEAEAEVKPEEVSAEASEKKAQDARETAIDEMEKASQKALDAMRENGNARNEEVVDDAEKKLDDIYVQFRAWMKENTQPERIKAQLDVVTKETAKVLDNTRKAVIDVANSEQFKSTMQSGKDFLTGTGAMISDGFKYGYDKLMEVPEFRKIAGKVDEGVDVLRHSTVLKNIVSSTEKGLNDFNNSLFGSLKSFFTDQPAPKKDDKEDLPDLPDQK